MSVPNVPNSSRQRRNESTRWQPLLLLDDPQKLRRVVSKDPLACRIGEKDVVTAFLHCFGIAIGGSAKKRDDQFADQFLFVARAWSMGDDARRQTDETVCDPGPGEASINTDISDFEACSANHLLETITQ